MHPNPVFRKAADQTNLEYARDRGFGVLSVNGDAGPLIAHIPFRLSDDGKEVELHLMRSNPIVRALRQPMQAALAVSGPDSYVSPDWYGIDDQVPTWNYIAVHLRGTLELRPQPELRGILDRLSEVFEARLEPKTPWTSDKMSEGVLERMMRMIVPCRMSLNSVDGTWKLGQNKPDAVRQAGADHMKAYGIGQETALLAALMHGTCQD